MKETILISERGQITLPSSFRKKYALGKDTPLIMEERPEGILLRKASLIPIRQYTEDEVQGFLKEDTLLPRDKKWLR